MRQIEHLLRQAIGLDASAIGSSLIQRAIRSRMDSAGVPDVEDYRRLVLTSAQEWNELVESVVVSETWFFREPESFSGFARLVQEEWAPAHPAGCLRVLSVPCASGEEPYSVAMALLDAGLPARRFQVEGIDISRRALERACAATYGKNSFRGQDLAFRDRYFQPANGGWTLDARVRRRVQICQGNLLGDDSTPQPGPYDFIFCRNLLIYFDRATQRRAFEKLNGWLTAGGVLFVGPAEISLAVENGFSPAGIPLSFACRRAPDSQPAWTPSIAGLSPVTPLATLPSGFSGRVAPAAHAAPRAAHVDLDVARRLADEGRLQEAEDLCHSHLRRNGASAQVYYLLGLVHDAAGHPQAADYYRKALYLEPQHRDTLWQLALLAQKRGDIAQARAFKRRVQRANVGKPASN